jgi:DNA-binding IclR family transcriptional regulator
MAKESRNAGENQSVMRALGILNLLAAVSEPLGVREIARRLRLPPSNIQRLVKTLAKSGYLEQAESTLRYTIGYRAFQVGNAFVAQNSLFSAVIPELYTLADHHVTGFLGVRREHSVVYLATVQSEGPISINHRPGSQTHLHSTAMGKALLAEMPDDEVRRLLGEGPLPRLTSRTKIAISSLIGDLRNIRRTGFATSDEENRQGFFSAGAVVRDSRGSAVAVISGAVPTATLKAQDRAKVCRLVLEAAQNASRKLGAANPMPSSHALRASAAPDAIAAYDARS